MVDEHDFKIGNVVRLLSGGGDMVVAEVQNTDCFVYHCGERISRSYIPKSCLCLSGGGDYELIDENNPECGRVFVPKGRAR